MDYAPKVAKTIDKTKKLKKSRLHYQGESIFDDGQSVMSAAVVEHINQEINAQLAHLPIIEEDESAQNHSSISDPKSKVDDISRNSQSSHDTQLK